MVPIIDGKQSLRKSDIQGFIKRLRKNYKQKIRYYAVGEYGTITERPHYHIILYGIGQSDSERISKAWRHKKSTPYGITYIGDCNDYSIVYAVKYHINYRTKKDFEIRGDTREPEFSLMSKKPPLGHKWFELNKDRLKATKQLYVELNGHKRAFPRHFRDKILNRIEKDIQVMQEIERSDVDYAKEIERLSLLGEKEPTQTYDANMHNKASQIKQKANRKDRF